MVSAVLVAGALTGCGENGETAAIEQPPVDPRYATAEALLDHVNSLLGQTPIDFPGFLELVYPESEYQNRLVQSIRARIPLFHLEVAVQQAFGQPTNPASPDWMRQEARGPARIGEHTGERVTAEFRDWDGASKRLYLVKVGSRWWVSGFTFEYDPDEDATEEMIAELRLAFKAFASVAPGLRQQIAEGEFATIDELQTALDDALMLYARQHPE